MPDPKPRELANAPPHLNREELEVLLSAVSDLQAGSTVNWDQIKPEYRPFVRRFIKPDRKRRDSRPLRRLLRRLLVWKRLEQYPEWIRDYVHRVQTFAGAEEVKEIIFLRDQNKALIKLVAELKAENPKMPELITPPDLTGFTAYCENCDRDRTVHMSKEADTRTNEVYYEYMCDECKTIVLIITPGKRQRQESTLDS